jgi:hypothetical protein
MEPYADSIEHLFEELARIDLLIRRALLLARASRAGTAEEFRGFVISETQIDALLHGAPFLGGRWRQQAALTESLRATDNGLDALRCAIDARREQTRRANRRLALPKLAQCFELSAAEVDLLLIALAPELDTAYEPLYGYLQDDATRRRPSVELALNLISISEREKIFARRLLGAEGVLLRHRLVELGEEAHDRQPSLLRKFIKPAESVVRFLLDEPPRTLGVGELRRPQPDAAALELEASTVQRLQNLATCLRHDGDERAVVRLIGTSDAGLRTAAEALCSALGRGLLLVELANVDADEAYVVQLARDAVLWGAALAVTTGEPGAEDAELPRLARAEAALWARLDSLGAPLLLLGPAAAFPRIPPHAHVWRLEVDAAGFDVRRAAWEQQLGAANGEVDPSRLADTFTFDGGQIRQAVDLAGRLAAVRDPTRPPPSMQDLIDAGRALTTPHLRRFARQVDTRRTWADIVLPEDRAQQLRGIAARMKCRHRVHRQWGFGQKLSRGKGLTVLFTGPSGTGKTMAAEVLAGELSLSLYQIDLSTVVSKYIGETEKNLSEIFREAELSQTLLFFDEADALFGKRTEVKDAHDRYANIEVNYLLQRIEQYEGMVVLATNLQRNLDEAFLRRLQEVVEFPFPDESLRERIWRGHLPPEAPRAADIDFEFLARQFNLTGGNIKNIVLKAAFLAAHDNVPIGMAHLIRSTTTEFQKQGKLSVKTDFGPYYGLTQRKP